MKTYIAILIGVAVLSGVVFGGYMYTNRHKLVGTPVANTLAYKTTNGDISRFFEGTSTLHYSFDIHTTATTTEMMDGLLRKITDGTSTVANVYFSFEGARGLTPLEYISEIVAPHVSVITPTGSSTFGAYDWTTAETPGSNWYIASVANGNWLVVVEGKKVVDLEIKHILETIKLEGNK